MTKTQSPITFHQSPFPQARTLEFKVGGVPVRVPWSTPVRWWVLLGVVLLTGLLFALSVRHAVSQRQAAFKIIVTDSAPSIVAAQRIRASLADFDANLANELLCAPGSPDLARAVESAGQRRQEFTDQVIIAAGNITSGEAERKPIATMVNELGTYEARMAQARTLQARGDAAGALNASREATRLMHEDILPAADALDAVNSRELDQTYAAQGDKSIQARVWMAVAGLFCLGALAGAQWLLWQDTRRRVNPGLLTATGLTLLFTLYGGAASLRSARQLKEATKDAFDSVRFLRTARALAYDANGAETRWLYDRAHAAEHARDFTDEAAKVGAAPPGGRLQDYAVRAGQSQGLPAGGFQGLLARELGNVTYPGELPAAAAAVRTWGDYLDVDREIRRLETAGQHDRAVALCLSYGPGGSNAAFDAFDLALGKTLAINEAAFARLAGEGAGGLRVFDWLIPAFALAAAGCAAGGFWPRLKEYAA